MGALSKHLIIDLFGCDKSILDDIKFIEGVLTEAAIIAKTTILHTYFHKFAPQGVSGVVVIAESHISIHTWPEFGHAAIDVFTCGNHAIPEKAASFIKEKFGAANTDEKILSRGCFME